LQQNRTKRHFVCYNPYVTPIFPPKNRKLLFGVGRPTMSLIDRLEAFLLLAPIIGLLGLGIGLTLRSGVVSLSSGQGMRRLAENLYQTLLMMGLCLILLALIQQFVGLRVHMW
jgi:hypothetical protein